MHLEQHVEAYFVKRVEALGGITAKMTILGRRGWPDRLAILPGGRIIFAELKRPKGGRLSAPQIALHALLRGLGAEVLVLKNKDEIDEALENAKGSS